MPIEAPVPTAAIGGALVKISASGPMPTSRYCDHSPFACSSFLSSIASGEPGLRPATAPPSAASTSARAAAARSGAPRACSSITRSSSEIAKVTPAALIACRSFGARNQGFARLRFASAVLARIAAKLVKAFARTCSSRRRPGSASRTGRASSRMRRVMSIDAVVAQHDDRRAIDVRAPHASDQRAGGAVRPAACVADRA